MAVERLSISFPEELKTILKAAAVRDTRKVSQLVRIMLKEGLERRGYKVGKIHNYPDTSIKRLPKKEVQND